MEEMIENDSEGLDESEPKKPAEQAKRFLALISSASSAEKDFRETARKSYARYIDDRKKDVSNKDDRRLNLYWANNELLLPAVLAASPKVEIGRRWKQRDDAARVASILWERATQYFTEPETFFSKCESATKNFLIAGRGVIWFRVETDTAMIEQPVFNPSLTGQEGDLPYEKTYGEWSTEEVEVVKAQRVISEHVHWDDFRHGACKKWEECPWVARRLQMTIKLAADTFFEGNKELAKTKLTFTKAAEEHADDDDKATAQLRDEQERADIWEFWNDEDKKIYWVSPGCDLILQEQSDPYGLPGFFPCAKPLLGTTSDDDLMPVPDYHFYRDNLKAIDEYTARARLLAKVIRAVCARDASQKELAKLLAGSEENECIAVKNWEEFAAKARGDDLIWFLPIEKFVAVLKNVLILRDQEIEKVYEITGISDIMRGSTEASETATAQNIKSNFGTLRLNRKRAQVVSFLRDSIEIVANLIANTFQEQTLLDVADVSSLNQSDLQHVPAALALIKGERRGFKIDIETNSTNAVDKQQQQAAATEFLTVVSKFLSEAVQFGAAAPAYTAVLGEMLMLAARKFDAGRTVEGMLEEANEMHKKMLEQRMAQQAQQAQAPQQPDPKMIELQHKMQMGQGELQIKQQAVAGELELKRTRQDFEMALELRDRQIQQLFDKIDRLSQNTGIVALG